jgi:hypothetical protein
VVHRVRRDAQVHAPTRNRSTDMVAVVDATVTLHELAERMGTGNERDDPMRPLVRSICGRTVAPDHDSVAQERPPTPTSAAPGLVVRLRAGLSGVVAFTS